MKIGIDLLGSENTPEALLKAAVDLMPLYPFELHAFGKKIPGHSLVKWHVTEAYVDMNDTGTGSAKNQQTSMFLGIQALKKGDIDAFITCGNTAALLTYSHLHLPKIPGITRCGLLAGVGTEKGLCYVIDVGANIQATGHQLLQFALIGQATVKTIQGKIARIGLLNMASEKGKGPTHLKQLYTKCSALQNFIGFVEPGDLFKGLCDLVITDGFTGNILLKTAEAVAHMTLGNKLDTTPFDPSSYPGALLCGADKIVMKCHGIGNTRALQKTIEASVWLHSQNYLTRVKEEISALKEESF